MEAITEAKTQSKTLMATLRSAEFTQGLKQKHLDRLGEMAFEVTFFEGETIFSEGDVGNLLYIIEEGLTAVESYISGRGRTTILTVGAGQLLGWSAFFPRKRKTASSHALQNTRALAINAHCLREACQADHDFGYEILWRIANLIADRLKATRLQLMDIYTPVD